MDVRALWDFEDPAASEERFRAAAAEAPEPDRSILMTQVARALALQERYAEAHGVLDELEPGDPETAVRRQLERGRVLRSSGAGADPVPVFVEAATLAADAGLEALEVDALHMVALAVPPSEQLAAGERALAAARSASDPVARDWDASVLNNLGMVHADAGDWVAALAVFEEALEARRRIGEADRERVARWMVAWTLRHLDRPDEALAMQQQLRADLAAAGEVDPYVEEELEILTGAGTPGP